MGGKSSKVDFRDLAQVGREGLSAAKQLANRQLAFTEQQYAEFSPIAREIAQNQIAAQEEQLRQAQDYYQYQVDTYRPLEQGLVRDAEQFSTESYRQRMAGEAAAAAGRAFNTAQQSLARADAARGLNPNSPAARAARQQAALGLAAQSADAQTQARDAAVQRGLALRQSAAGLGRNLAGASTAAYGSSVGAGAAGAGTYQAAGSQYMAGLSAGANTMMSGYQIGGGLLNNAVGYSMDQRGQNMEMLGALGGAAIGVISDRRLKEDIEFHHVDENSGINMYTFKYIGVPDRVFLGVMADEVEPLFPQAVIYDDLGYASVDYAALGMRMIELTKEAA